MENMVVSGNNNCVLKASGTVTVIIPTFNRAEFLPFCLDSILSQTHKPDQIIVVDDGSTDRTSDVIKPYLKAIEYLRKRNGGKSSAINAIRNLINGSYVWIMDDDDLATPKALEQLLKPHIEDPTLDYSFGYIVPAIIKGGNIVSQDSNRRMPSWFDQKMHRYRLTERNYFSLNSCLINRQTFLKIGPFDETLIRSQDYDFLLRLTAHAKISYIDRQIFWVSEHQGVRGSATTPVPYSKRNLAWLKYDRIAGENLLGMYSIDAFIHPELNTADPTIRNRSAEIRKAYIAAQKGLVDKSLEYLRSATLIAGSSSNNLHTIEKATIHDLFGDSEFFERICTDDSFRRSVFESIKIIPAANVEHFFSRRLYWNARSSIQNGNKTEAICMFFGALRAFLKNY
jgi:hypothetical protein